MDKNYWDTFLEELNPPNGGNQINYPNHNLSEPSRTNYEAPRHSSYHSPTPPMYQPFNMPIYQPTQETQTFPDNNTPPNAHPSYHFLKDRPIKIETPSPPIQWLKCDTDPNKWYTKSPIPDETNSQPINGEGSSRKPRMRVRMPHEIFSPIPITSDDTQPMEEDPEDPEEEPEEEDPKEEDPEEEDPEEEDPEEESELEIEDPGEESNIEEEHPNNQVEMSITKNGSLTSNQPSYGSVDPYEHYLETLKIRTSSSFPSYQEEIPSEQEQADEIREQNRVAEYLYLSANGEYVEYPEPRNHYEMVAFGYRDPPPQYGYPHVIPQSYEEHLDRALRESDDLRKQIDVENKKKKSMGVKIARKYKKIARMVKKFTKD